jgi:glycosyltransferase involved in cell wall biosynthesis
MTRIIHVAHFGRKPIGAFQHSVERKLSNGLIRNGHAVVNFSDRDMARAGSWLGHRRFGAGAANRELRNLCRSVEPDLLLLGHADVITPATIADIKDDWPSLRVLQWNVDPIFRAGNVSRIASKLEVVDATLVSTAGEALRPFMRPGKVVGFLPNPVDYSIETGRNHEQPDLPYGLFYSCGNGEKLRHTCGEAWRPDDLIQLIERAAPELRTLLPGLRGQPQIAGAQYQSALESAAIGLNLSRRNDVFLYSSDRLAQMIGNGLAVLVDRDTGYNTLFGEDELAFFSTTDELVEQVRRLIADPTHRQQLAKRGREHYHALFNEQSVAQYVVDVAFGALDPSAYPWPTLISDEARPQTFVGAL